MKLNIAVLPGDGIGPEIMKQGLAVMDAIAVARPRHALPLAILPSCSET